MILGVLSDTHGDRKRTAAAIGLLRRLGAEAFVHCGDVGSTDVLDELAGQRAWIVLGNTDGNEAAWEHYGDSLGLTVRSPPLRVTCDGYVLVVFHGHERAFRELINHALESGTLPEGFDGCAYVLHGHTHIASDVWAGPVRVVNPGALHRSMLPTVATIDLDRGQVRFWEVNENGAADPQNVSREDLRPPSE